MKALFSFLLVLLSCGPTSRHPPGGPYYFESFSGYSYPLQPDRPIAESEARRRQAYIAAHYDHEGRVIRIEKYLNGQIQWADSYEYNGDRLVKRVGTDWEGKQKEIRFDE